ncbi:MFS transporter [Natronococcus occultus]|uniref:Arabinose efflux permease family protein n=1 Tax=Natronococcus occultus SP4 TaxID=694430 RepID=L0K1W2_9EURY|nr:MFS transporter [Natronococcus occultus]AGB38991.1 arabinose efflux permease family protein [Natronococcus occultus SP4]
MSRLDSIRRELAGLWAGGTGKTLLAIALGWGLLNGTRMIYPVLLPYFSAEFDLTLSTAGLLVTLIWLGYAIGQVPGGILADRHGERSVLVASVSMVVVGVTVVLFAPNAAVLFGATALVGLGHSQYPIARITALSELYPDRIGRVLGVTMASGDVGQTVLPPIASVLAVAVAWRLGLGFVLPLLCVTAVVIWLTLPAPDPEDGDASSENLRYVIRELRSPVLAIMGVILFLFIFVWQTFSAFYPTYLVEQKGLSSTVAGVLFGLFFAVGVVVKPIAGMAYDRVGLRGSLPLILLGSVVGLALLPFVDGFVGLVGVTVLASTMLGSGAITQSYLAEIIPAEIQGTGLGVIRSSASVLGASGPVVFGVIAERGYFDAGYLLLALIVGAGTLLTLRMPRE